MISDRVLISHVLRIFTYDFIQHLFSLSLLAGFFTPGFSCPDIKSDAIALAGLAPSQGEEGHEELPDTSFLLVVSDASNIISSFQI